MTDILKVEMRHRKAAAPLFRLYGAETYAAICEKGENGSSGADRLAMVQAFARFERDLGVAELVGALEWISAHPYILPENLASAAVAALAKFTGDKA